MDQEYFSNKSSLTKLPNLLLILADQFIPLLKFLGQLLCPPPLVLFAFFQHFNHSFPISLVRLLPFRLHALHLNKLPPAHITNLQIRDQIPHRPWSESPLIPSTLVRLSRIPDILQPHILYSHHRHALGPPIRRLRYHHVPPVEERAAPARRPQDHVAVVRDDPLDRGLFFPQPQRLGCWPEQVLCGLVGAAPDAGRYTVRVARACDGQKLGVGGGEEGVEPEDALTVSIWRGLWLVWGRKWYEIVYELGVRLGFGWCGCGWCLC